MPASGARGDSGRGVQRKKGGGELPYKFHSPKATEELNGENGLIGSSLKRHRFPRCLAARSSAPVYITRSQCRGRCVRVCIPLGITVSRSPTRNRLTCRCFARVRKLVSSLSLPASSPRAYSPDSPTFSSLLSFEITESQRHLLICVRASFSLAAERS